MATTQKSSVLGLAQGESGADGNLCANGARARSSSPWVPARGGNPPGHLDEGGGIGTPDRVEGGLPASPSQSQELRRSGSLGSLGSRTYLGMRGSTPIRAGLGASALQNTLAASTKKEMEGLEERITSQINRVASRFDTKISAFEGLQPKIDRKLAEMSGYLKALSDELQSQTRRVDSTDSHFWEWRKEMENQWRTKCASFEQSTQATASACRVATETADERHKKTKAILRRLEKGIEDRMRQGGEQHQHLLDISMRVEMLEANQVEHASLGLGESVVTMADQGSAIGSAQWQLEQKLSDTIEKVERLEANDLDGQTRAQEHEVRFSSLRSKLDAQEQQCRSLADRVGQTDWEARFEELGRNIADESRKCREVSDRLKVFGKKAEDQDQVVEEFAEQMRGLQEQLMRGDHMEQSTVADSQVLGSVSIAEANDVQQLAALQACVSRIDENETFTSGLGQRLDSLTRQLDDLRRDTAKLKDERPAAVATVTQAKPDATVTNQIANLKSDLADMQKLVKQKCDVVSQPAEGTSGKAHSLSNEQISKVEKDLAALTADIVGLKSAGMKQNSKMEDLIDMMEGGMSASMVRSNIEDLTAGLTDAAQFITGLSTRVEDVVRISEVIVECCAKFSGAELPAIDVGEPSQPGAKRKGVHQLRPSELQKGYTDPPDAHPNLTEDVVKGVDGLKATLSALKQCADSRKKQTGELRSQVAAMHEHLEEAQSRKNSTEAHLGEVLTAKGSDRLLDVHKKSCARRESRSKELADRLAATKEQASRLEGIARRQRSLLLHRARVMSIGGKSVVERHPAGALMLETGPVPDLSSEDTKASWDVGSAIANPYVTDSWPIHPNSLAQRAPEEPALEPLSEGEDEDNDESEEETPKPQNFGRFGECPF